MPQDALHQTFSWFHPGVNSVEAEFLERVYDICEGAKTVLEIVQRDKVETEHQEAPIFEPVAAERLILMTTHALAMLGTAAFGRINELNNAAEASKARWSAR